MKVRLTVRQRIDLQGVLPQKSTFIMMKMLRKVREALSFTDVEHQSIKLKQNEDGSVQWNGIKAKEIVKEVDFPNTICDLIKKAFKALDEKGEVTDAHVELFEMFMGKKK